MFRTLLMQVAAMSVDAVAALVDGRPGERGIVLSCAEALCAAGAAGPLLDLAVGHAEQHTNGAKVQGKSFFPIHDHALQVVQPSSVVYSPCIRHWRWFARWRQQGHSAFLHYGKRVAWKLASVLWALVLPWTHAQPS